MNTLMATFVAAILHITQPYAESHSYTLTQSDTLCLAEAIYHEARGERDGGAAIAFVALNRAIMHNQSLCQVIHAKHQFSYYTPSHPKPIREPDAWKLSVYLAVYTQLGLIHNPIGNATSYNERPVRAWLRDLAYIKKIDHMYFYEIRQNMGSPPLIQTHIETTPLLPRQITCDKEDTSRKRRLTWTDVRVAERLQDAPPHIPRPFDRHEFEVNRPSETVIVALSPTIPFPEKPSLSSGQVMTLVSALTSEVKVPVVKEPDRSKYRMPKAALHTPRNHHPHYHHA